MTIFKNQGKALNPALRGWREAVPNDRLAHLIKDATRAVSRALQTRLMEHSVSFGHWTFLRILWERDGITQRALSELAGVSEPTTYGALQTMEKLGYISRRKLPSNMRNICIYLTPEGQALKEVLVPMAEEVNEVLVRGIPARDVALFRKTLLCMIQNLAQDELDSDRSVPPSRKMC
jgi:DNA-binding MarR family transcriptional regulator